MNLHCETDTLSSYVDDELSESERLTVQSHLDDCPDCQHRLNGLRRVVRELSSLSGVEPPTDLGMRVQQAVRLEGELSLLHRTEHNLRRWLNQPSLLPLFGIVVALAIFLYLLAVWLENAEHRGTTRLVIPQASPSQSVPDDRPRLMGGRRFLVTATGWREEGLEGPAMEVLELSRPDEEFRDLEVFRPLGGRVLLRYQEQVVEVVFGEPGL